MARDISLKSLSQIRELRVSSEILHKFLDLQDGKAKISSNIGLVNVVFIVEQKKRITNCKFKCILLDYPF